MFLETVNNVILFTVSRNIKLDALSSLYSIINLKPITLVYTSPEISVCSNHNEYQEHLYTNNYLTPHHLAPKSLVAQLVELHTGVACEGVGSIPT